MHTKQFYLCASMNNQAFAKQHVNNYIIRWKNKQLNEEKKKFFCTIVYHTFCLMSLLPYLTWTPNGIDQGLHYTYPARPYIAHHISYEKCQGNEWFLNPVMYISRFICEIFDLNKCTHIEFYISRCATSCLWMSWMGARAMKMMS